MKIAHHSLLPDTFEIAAGLCAGFLIAAALFALLKMSGITFGGHSTSMAEAPVPVAPVEKRKVNPELQSRETPSTVQPPPAVKPRKPRFANFNGVDPTPDARYVANWVADSRDAAGADFVIVDKKDARIYVFDADARLRGSTPVLLGLAAGDDNAPDIGARPISQVLPSERTTAAGRFVGERGRNARGEDVVWVDYDAGVSMHRVINTNPKERRLERLATPTNADNRVSYGCINVPVAFYENYLRPTFANQRAIVYVLPEFKSIEQVFGAYDVGARSPDRPREQALVGPDPLIMLLVALRTNGR